MTGDGRKDAAMKLPAKEVVARGADRVPSADVLLVSLPFGVLHSPSLALGILKTRLQAAGIDAICRHFTLDYAARFGVDIYGRIAAGFPRTTDLLGEWIFSHALSPRSAAQRERYLTRLFGTDAFLSDPGEAANGGPVRPVEMIVHMADRAGEFADYAAKEILSHSPKIVGFTSVFQQNMATLAVAKRVRRLDPSVKIVLGGANCEGPMGRELARLFPFIDLVVSGEADLTIVPIVQSLLAGENPRESAKVGQFARLADSEKGFLQTRMVPDLDGQVSPCFDDYFDDLDRNRAIKDGIAPEIPMESSRGCWWGAKSHCTFCGLNGSTMTFRSRSPDDVIDEIIEHSRRHPGTKISFVDNIMDYRYFDLLLPKLSGIGTSLDIFYEIKSNVSKRQVKALKDAGVGHIQPGIESLSDQVLKTMKKGVRAIQNLQLLKWCLEFGVKVDWNILWGFPGEDPGEYGKMAALLPLISHLPPPARGSKIRLDRFSPNFSSLTAAQPSRVRPYDAYYDIYDGMPDASIFNLSYFFKTDDDPRDEVGAYTRDLAAEIERWKACHSSSGLFYMDLDDRLALFDSRPICRGRSSRLLGVAESRIYALCDTARPLSFLDQNLTDVPRDTISAILDDLCGEGVMWSDGSQYLALAASFPTFLHARKTANVEQALGDMLLERSAA
jgi:ribosomal peptide maturation radical SAM protein 1